MEEMIGFLQDEGYSQGEIDEMISPMDAYEGRATADSSPGGQAGADVREAVTAVLTAARDGQQQPGPQKAVTAVVATKAAAKKVVPSVPAAKAAMAVRVDTEGTYRDFKAGGAPAEDYGDLPDVSEDWTEAIERGQRAALFGETAAQQGYIVGYGVGPQGDQACILCGRAGAGSAVCAECRAHRGKLLQAVLGFGERGSAADIYGDFGDRGSAADIYGIGYTARQMELLGYTARQMELVGYTARQMELIGEVDALEVPAGAESEEVPLSFSSAVDPRHITAWKRGDSLYSSIRLVGWDGHSRILTATMPYGKSLGIVVGYAQSAAPYAPLSIIDPLARQLGAGSLIPRLAAGSPAVLHAVHGKPAPFITAAVQVR